MQLTHNEHTGFIDDILVYADYTTSPPFPELLDGASVQRGADIFHGRVDPAVGELDMVCSDCHGTYTKLSAASDDAPGAWSVNHRDTETDGDGVAQLDASGNPVTLVRANGAE